tara:strand:+ start:3332 stop:3661 length:330 start_codon:yes stop_codon:yes gene_type:complete
MAKKITGPGKKGQALTNEQFEKLDRRNDIRNKGAMGVAGAAVLGSLFASEEVRGAVKTVVKKGVKAIKQGATAARNALRPKGDWVSDPNDSSKMIREKSPSRRAVPRPK